MPTGASMMHIPDPCAEEVEIVHVDDDILVVRKPAGLLSIPGRYVRDCVLHRMFFEYPDVLIVHRLDLATSGLMVLARSTRAARELSRQFRERAVEKTYEAQVWGKVVNPQGEIDAPLAPSSRKPLHRVDFEHGKAALTRFVTLQTGADTSRVRLFPQTGRSHQLRVHMAYIGHPILGCDLYGHDRPRLAASRLMLHAAKLCFAHPENREWLTFEWAPDWA